MVIDWHTTRAEADATLSYRAEGEQTWRRARAGSLPFPHAERWIHRVELTGLRSDATYEFRTGTEEPVYRFRTMPRTASRPVRFVAGGDVRHDAAWMEATARHATAYDPDFVSGAATSRMRTEGPTASTGGSSSSTRCATR
jgi:acid phosphatase type 7